MPLKFLEGPAPLRRGIAHYRAVLTIIGNVASWRGVTREAGSNVRHAHSGRSSSIAPCLKSAAITGLMHCSN